MENVFYYTLVTLQITAILFLFGQIIYISSLKPSKFQSDMLLLLASTMIMLVGYLVEIMANIPESALVGAATAYIGKPFALLMTLVFIGDYCNRPIPRRLVFIIAVLCTAFPILVFTNGYSADVGHHLYYGELSFDISRTFSPLIIVSRGPLYLSYSVYLVLSFAAILYYIISEFKNASKSGRKQLYLLFFAIIATVIGYVLYLFGITGGYDTTMTGAAIGTLCLTLVFFKFRLFDSLTLAKEEALHNASNGLLVLNENNKPIYTNAVIDNMLENGFTVEEFIGMTDKSEICKNERVYEIKKSDINRHGVEYGKTVEVHDITEKHNYRSRLEKDVSDRTKEIKNIQRSIIASFAGIVEARDNSTGEHVRRMSRYVEIIARELKKAGVYSEILNDEYIESLIEVAPLHDIGKLTVPDSILLKPGRLTDEEFEIIKGHSSQGARLVKECLDGVERPEYVKLAESVAKYHHEKWSGAGYPEGLKGEKIPLCARIVAVADVYDAIRSERCYKPPMNIDEARKVIADGSGVHFDPMVVKAFLSAVDEIEKV